VELRAAGGGADLAQGDLEKALSVYFDALEPTLRRAVEMAEANGWAAPANSQHAHDGTGAA
jgi:hypothetical protein